MPLSPKFIFIYCFFLWGIAANAQPSFAHFYEPGVFQVKNKTQSNTNEFLLIKLNAMRTAYELHFQNEQKEWYKFSDLAPISLNNLPASLSSGILVDRKINFAIAYNFKKDELWLYELKTKKITPYKNWFKQSFEINDYRSGACEIAPIDANSFFFRISTASEYGHLAYLEGIAIKESISKFIFRDFDYETMLRLNLEDDPLGCTLVFEFVNPKNLILKQEYCSYYHGASIYFDGTYILK